MLESLAKKHMLPSDPPASQSLSAALKDAQVRLVVTLRRRVCRGDAERVKTGRSWDAYRATRRRSATDSELSP